MKITISGTPGSGKSTVAKYLAKRFKLRHYSVGDFMRELARKKGMTLMQLSKKAEKDKSIDEELDKMQLDLQKKDDFVLDSRIGWHFLPDSIKLFLNVELEEGAKRIFRQKRKIEKENITFKGTLKNIKRRMASERLRYKNLYGIDIDNLANFDILIDTTSMSIKEMNKAAEKAVKKFIGKS